MLTMYCDASGDDQSAVIRVGGWVASADDWSAFDAEWRAALKAEGIAFFHMREFAHSVDQFKDWKGDKSRRERFLERLCQVIVKYAKYNVGAGVLLEIYRRVDGDYQLHEQFHPYTLCGVTCMDEAVQWRSAQHREDEALEFVFESGDQHQGQLLVEGEKFAHVAPLFKTKTEATPLQAADLMAYEQLKATNVETERLFLRFRTPFQRLLAVAHKHGNFDEHWLRVFCRMHEVPRRSQTQTRS